MGVLEARDTVVGMEPLAVLLHPRPRAVLNLRRDELLVQDPTAPVPLAVELPRAQKGLSCFLRVEAL